MTGANVEELLEAVRVNEYWGHLAWWYRQVRGKQTHPNREGLDQVSEDMADLYRCRLPEGLQVLLLVQPEVVNDNIPEEAEIKMAVGGLKSRRAGVPTFMRTEDLKGWLREAKCEKDPVIRRW